MRLRFQVPASTADAVTADMSRAGYDVTLQPADPTAGTCELVVWIFAGQSALQAELLVKRLAPKARLVRTR